MDSQNPELPISEERRVLTLQGPTPGRFSEGPLTVEQTQVKSLCVDALWRILREGAPKYLRSSQQPRLDPILISSLTSLGQTGAFPVLHQVHEEISRLFGTYEAQIPPYLQEHVSLLLGSIITDITSRVDHVLYEHMYAALEAGEIIEGASLEPILSDSAEWDDSSSANVGAKVIPFRQRGGQSESFANADSPASLPDAQEA